MGDPVFGRRTAFCFFEDVGEVGGGDEADGFADFGDFAGGVGEEILRVFAAEVVVVGQRGEAGVLFEDPQEITAVDEELPGHGVQGEFFPVVGFDVASGGLGQGFAGGSLVCCFHGSSCPDGAAVLRMTRTDSFGD